MANNIPLIYAGGTKKQNPAGDGIQADIVAEQTADAGVTIDGLKLKDSGIVVGSDADGDIYVRSGGALTRLGKGTGNQLLSMDSGATALEWADLGNPFDQNLNTENSVGFLTILVGNTVDAPPSATMQNEIHTTFFSASGHEAISGSDMGGYDAWHGFDGNPYYPNNWRPLGLLPDWLGYIFNGNPRVLTQYKMSCPQYLNYANAMPKDFKFQGSDNGTDWDDLDTQTSVGWAAFVGETKSFDIPAENQRPYEQYRVYVTAVGPSDWMTIGELELWGHELSTTDPYIKLDNQGKLRFGRQWAGGSAQKGLIDLSAQDELTFTGTDPGTKASINKIVDHLDAGTTNGAGAEHIPSGGTTGKILVWDSDGLPVWSSALAAYADNAAAKTGGLTDGAFYHTDGVVKVVYTP